MAIYHLSVSNVSRAKGSNSCATLAYISGEKIHDSRTGKTYSYSRRERVLVVETILPASAPLEYTNAETLWNAVENYETADNARTAKKIQVALPRELELSEQKTIVEEYIRQNLAQEGYCATYAIHDGGTRGNPHAHILVSNRTIDRKGNWGVKRKMAYALDERGNRIPLLNEDGTQRTDGNGRRQWKRVTVEQNKLDSKDFLLRLRKAWADVVNRYLSPSEQIDHRSNVARSIEDIPTIHEGYAARAIEETDATSNINAYDPSHRNDVIRVLHSDKVNTLTARMGTGGHNVPLVQKMDKPKVYVIAGNVIGRKEKNGGNGRGFQEDKSYTLTSSDRHVVSIHKKALVRRITPLECERLQGLPDHYTNLKDTPCSDSARYKAIGNGMAQPCADFVLKRLSLAVGPGIKEWIPTETADQHRDSEKVIDFQKYHRHAKQKSKNQ